MATSIRILSVVLLAALLLTGCGHVLPEAALERVDAGIDFAALQRDPAQYKGRTVLLGGVILGLDTGKDDATVEVLNWHLDRRGEPFAQDEAGGRFLVRTDRWLDPAIYMPGRLITLVGEVEGVETRELYGTDYRYPVVRLRENHVWEPPYDFHPGRRVNPYAPSYVLPPGTDNPYNPGYAPYPWSPYYLRTH
ncbi:outer membrane lipoprotein [Geothermobacter ehrlichii]|uniref:Outer membrane lipoprotein n=1 Tax=Geothermobacter ehrlichii TaxID=213224 RepID=A0A5D3WMU7_9BACT|nr:Slp/YeaY family lipoprotein [Geothermobacter ehrlichii]TYO99706.1 outer membrane lipoprotein [Geothermobacter ehrlichii]